MDNNISQLLREYAQKYETKDFLTADPSVFMHKVKGAENQETTAFIASSLSYGNRKQFFPKIQFFLDSSHNEVYSWVKNGEYKNYIPNNSSCYYRLYTNENMLIFLQKLQEMLQEYGTIKSFIKANNSSVLDILKAITQYFSHENTQTIIPKNANSSCKRLCMFLRWMVRDNSEVDLGLWKDVLDKRDLIMPLDTHVLQQSIRLGLLTSKTATMNTAIKLTNTVKNIFPNDPLKADFALFGYGVNHKNEF